MKIKNWGIFSLQIGIALIPALIAFLILQNNNVNMPAGDQIRTPGEHFEELALGNFNINNLFRPHNDSRKALPSAIILLLSLWDGVWLQSRERTLAILIGILSVIIMAIIYHITLPNNKRLPFFLTICFATLYFAPASYYRWTYAPLHRIFPDFLLILSCLIYTLKVPLSQKTLYYALISISAQFSFVSGLFLWLCNILLLSCDQANVFQQKIRNVLILISIAGIAITLYLLGNYELHDSGVEAQSLSETLLAFPVIFIGSFNHNLNIASSTLLGYGLLLIFIVFSIINIRSRYIKHYLPYFVICLWIILLSIPLSLKRATLIMDSSQLIRYYNTSAIFLIGFLSFILITAHNRKWLKPLSVFICSCLLILVFYQNVNSVSNIRQIHSEFLTTKVYYDFINFIPDKWLELRYRFDDALPRLRLLSESGFLPFSPFQKFPPISTNPLEESGVEGEVTSLSFSNDHFITSGWAALQGTPADSVVLVSNINQQMRQILKIAPVLESRQNLAQQKGNQYLYTGWSSAIDANKIVNKDNLEIYAYDSSSRKLYPLPTSSNQQSVNKSKKLQE